MVQGHSHFSEKRDGKTIISRCPLTHLLKNRILQSLVLYILSSWVKNGRRRVVFFLSAFGINEAGQELFF